MKIINPQQELFTALKLTLEAQGYDVYDGALPPEDTPYPFIYLGDISQTDAMTKDAVMGDVTQTIHIWGDNPRRRGDISSMISAVYLVCRAVSRTEHYAWLMADITQRLLPDNTTKTPLLHGIIEARYRFSRR